MILNGMTERLTNADLARALLGDDEPEWIWMRHASGLPVGAMVREVDGRLVVTQVRIGDPDNDGPELTNDMVRSVTIPEMEAWLNARLVPSKPSRAEQRRMLQRPKQGRYPDSFFENLAIVYRQANAERVPPAPYIAELTGAPVPTVHGWVREARRRGLMPAGRQGRAG